MLFYVWNGEPISAHFSAGAASGGKYRQRWERVVLMEFNDCESTQYFFPGNSSVNITNITHIC